MSWTNFVAAAAERMEERASGAPVKYDDVLAALICAVEEELTTLRERVAVLEAHS